MPRLTFKLNSRAPLRGCGPREAHQRYDVRRLTTQCNGRMELRASQLGQHSMRLYYLSILYGPMGELYHLGVGARLHQPPCYVICYIMLCAPCPKPSVARSCARWRTWFRFGFGVG